MAYAVLHLICGNCGCADNWEWEYKPADGEESDDVYLWCRNCSTLHPISDNAEKLEVSDV